MAIERLPTVINLTCTNADTEYSQEISTGSSFEFQARTEATLRYAFVTGKVATPTAPYMTLKAGDYFYSQAGFGTTTLYVASPTAGTVVEILVWI